MNQGRIEAIHIVAAAGESPTAVDGVKAVAGQGLEADRYATGEGIKPGKAGGKRAATLIEAEALEALAHDYDVQIGPGESRRNITTRGIALNHLVGQTFKVGEAMLHGVELCEPCNYLESLTRPGVRAGLVHRGGLRAEILESGMIRIGDVIHG
jgi:MOSC domain-containing protein YiiM